MIKFMNPTEKPAVLLCALCVLGGALLLIHPLDEKMLQPRDTGGCELGGLESVDNISAAKSRVYGGLALLFGVGLGGTAFIRERK
jgi:hypothetical protein